MTGGRKSTRSRTAASGTPRFGRAVAGGESAPTLPGIWQEYTPKIVEDLLQTALAVLLVSERLNQRNFPQSMRAAWPLIVQDYWDAYGRTPAGSPPARPTGQQLALAYQVWPWVLAIGNPRDRFVVCARLQGVPFPKIAYRIGFTEAWCRRRIYPQGLQTICDDLNGKRNFPIFQLRELRNFYRFRR